MLLELIIATALREEPAAALQAIPAEIDFFIHNLLVRIHSIVEMISGDRPCAIGV